MPASIPSDSHDILANVTVAGEGSVEAIEFKTCNHIPKMPKKLAPLGKEEKGPNSKRSEHVVKGNKHTFQ